MPVVIQRFAFPLVLIVSLAIQSCGFETFTVDNIFIQICARASLSVSVRTHHSILLIAMDWQGQKLAEHLMQIMLLAFAVGAFATGYVTGSFQTMILIYAGGVVLTTLITVPNWPFFNHHPLKWLDPSEAEKHPKPQLTVNSKKKSAKKN